MKKIATILLLFLLLFNFIGYRFFFFALQQKAETNIVAKIDKQQYNDAQLVTITVPLSMPYITDSKDFEDKDGEITLNGKVYHYVKQKIFQGNLVLKCLADEQKTHLQDAKTDIAKASSDNNSSSKKSGGDAPVLKLVLSDYEELQTTASAHCNSINLLNTFNSNNSFATQKGEGIMPEQPPEA